MFGKEDGKTRRGAITQLGAGVLSLDVAAEEINRGDIKSPMSPRGTTLGIPGTPRAFSQEGLDRQDGIEPSDVVKLPAAKDSLEAIKAAKKAAATVEPVLNQPKIIPAKRSMCIVM